MSPNRGMRTFSAASQIPLVHGANGKEYIWTGERFMLADTINQRGQGAGMYTVANGWGLTIGYIEKNVAQAYLSQPVLRVRRPAPNGRRVR